MSIRLIQNAAITCLLIFFACTVSCKDNVDGKIKQNKETFENSQSYDVIPNQKKSIETATIINTMNGRLLNNQKTMLISINKGSEDGIYIGLSGYVLIHPSALNSFRVTEIKPNTAIMEGWYYPNIHAQATILLGFGNISDNEIWNYINREKIKAPAWENF
jgi:hypothetical protein